MTVLVKAFELLIKAERDALSRRHGFVAKRRYRPLQLSGTHDWKLHRASGERWFGFDAVQSLPGLPPEILMIPLRGHTEGHAGIAVQSDKGWLLHAGDAYFHEHEIRRRTRSCPIGLRLYQRMMKVDRPARLSNQQRLRELSLDHGEEIKIICAHDVAELDAAQAGVLL